MAQRKSNKKMSQAQKVGVGIGLTTAAVAAAGVYFLYGSKDAKKNRKKVKGWMIKARGDILEALEKADGITQEEYNALVEAVGGAYSRLQNASQSEIKDFKKEMKEHWKDIERSGAKKKIKSAVKKVIKNSKKAAKKVAKKASPKKKTAKKSTKKSSKKSTKR